MAINLIESLALERIEVNLFRGTSPSGRGPRIFGGHVIAQALLAGYKTIDHQVCHSIHAYFIRPGDPSVPILYEVDRSRDGKSFATRRVIAIQHGAQIFNLAASFQVEEEGLEHQDPMPDVPLPDQVPVQPEYDAWDREIEQRHLDRRDETNPDPSPPVQNVWMRARDALGDDVAINQAALAYASDMSFMSTGMRPHRVNWRTPGFQSASLDHAIWFHRRSQFNQWHLFNQMSPSASGARGFNFGNVFDISGRLVASIAQEGLMRRAKGMTQVKIARIQFGVERRGACGRPFG